MFVWKFGRLLTVIITGMVWYWTSTGFPVKAPASKANQLFLATISIYCSLHLPPPPVCLGVWLQCMMSLRFLWADLPVADTPCSCFYLQLSEFRLWHFDKRRVIVFFLLWPSWFPEVRRLFCFFVWRMDRILGVSLWRNFLSFTCCKKCIPCDDYY